MSEHGTVRRIARSRTRFAVAAWVVALLGGLPALSVGQLIEFDDEKVFGYALFDILEVAPNVDGRPVDWDFAGWIGKNYTRIWFKSDGNLYNGQERSGEMEFQALYSRLIAPYWELQAGVRADVADGSGDSRNRTHLVLGVEGLAPYWFEIEPAVFISQDGDLSASLAATYDLFMTQRIIVQPRLDIAAAAQEVPDWGVGSGLNGFGLGLRIRYEIRREFAPYVGVRWTRRTGGSADLARLTGEDTEMVGLVAGLRLWR